MESLPDKKKVDEALNRISEDKLFKRAQIYVNLLRFLVDHAYKGTYVKEQVIGLELFKEEYPKDHNDSKIRVTIYYLRKKLKAYYAGAGKDDEIRFIIEKGQYNLIFKSKKEIKKDTNIRLSISLSKKHLYVLIAFIIISFGIFNLLKRQEYYCWTNFFQSEASNICIVADHIIIKTQHSADNIQVHSFYGNITNEKDFFNHKEQNTEAFFKLGTFTVFTKMAPHAIFNLAKFFIPKNYEFSIKIESELRYEDVKGKNLIYIGQSKTMNISKSLFLKDSKVFKVIKDGFAFSNSTMDTIFRYSRHEDMIKEYAMVSFFPIETDQHALFFVSDNDIGVTATVTNFTDTEWLHEFYDSIPKGTVFFNALFAVEGMERTDRKCELVLIEAFDKQLRPINP